MRVPPPLAIFVGVLLGAVAVPFALRRDRAAKSAFEYVAPEGFAEASGEARRKLTQGATQPVPNDDSRILPPPEVLQHPDRKAWFAPELNKNAPPRIVLVHADRTSRLDDATLARVASEMIEHQRGQGMSFSTSKYEVIERGDGARVGFVAWDVESAPESSQPATASRRTVQLTFPDDTGMSIVTATYARDDEAVVAPKLRASVDTARGVAVQAAPFALWIRLVLAVLGGALGYWIARRRAVPADVS